MIIRNIVSLSAVYSEIAFVILCALKRVFFFFSVFFYKGELWGFDLKCFHILHRLLLQHPPH